MPEWSDVPATPEEYVALRVAAGLRTRSLVSAEVGLAAGLYGVWLRAADGALVGMGRVTGDGGCFAQINDMAVVPALQGQGWGREILLKLLAWCDAELPEGCYINLIAAPKAMPLYARMGFDVANGMGRYVK